MECAAQRRAFGLFGSLGDSSQIPTGRCHPARRWSVSAASCWWVMPSRFLAHSMTFPEMSAGLLGVVDFVATIFFRCHVAQENRKVYIVRYFDVSLAGWFLSRASSIRSTAREWKATEPRLRWYRVP